MRLWFLAMPSGPIKPSRFPADGGALDLLDKKLNEAAFQPDIVVMNDYLDENDDVGVSL